MIGALVLAAALAGPVHGLPAQNLAGHATVTVAPGDSLWDICADATGHGAWWPGLYAANRRTVGADPDLIFPGQRLTLACHPGPVPARMTAAPARAAGSRGEDDGGAPARPHGRTVPAAGRAAGGTLSCAGLERLWEAAGGARQAAFTAAEIAEAESGGRQYATGPAGERGYWQIHPDHGALSTYDPFGNARAAVIISGDGRNWAPWTTYTTGAYLGRC